MRTPALILGLLLLVAGILVSAGVFKVKTQETVAKLGPMEITTTQEKRPPPMLGYVLMGVGVLVLVVGIASRK